MPDRPPSFVSCATLARELDVSETTVYEMVRRGILPKPAPLSKGCVRWRWADVEQAIGSLAGPAAPDDPDDPYMAGARNAAQA